jgi:hypothetical protein
MIVVISDLHLQHTSRDVVRRNEGGKVLETKVVRNVTGAALALLFSEIRDNAERTGAKEIHLVFAGDVFELHRTPEWLIGGETLRPTLHPAAGSDVLERKAHTILDAIEHDNAGFFAVLAKFVETGVLVHHGEPQTLEGPRVVTHYIPGNHDRLAGLWPSMRRRVRALLHVEAPAEGAGAPFPHHLDWDAGSGYGVRVRHGHEYDATNFSAIFDPGAPSELAYDAPALGDFVTVDIATRLAVAFRARYARQLRSPARSGAWYRGVYSAITEFDDVRPQSMLIHYLSDAIGANEDETFAILRPVLRDAFETSMADAFFVENAKRLGFGRYFEGGFARMLDAALRNMSGNAVQELLGLIDRLHFDKTAKGPASFAQKEPGLSTGAFSVVVAGHTHEPDHVAIPGKLPPDGPGTAAYFLDSGTWRTRIDAGVGGAFGRLRGYTMVFCYHDDELRAGECRRFETWTGHLQAEDYGPMFDVDVTPARLPAEQTVRFTECRVEHIDEGDTLDGAELALCLGVDGAGLELDFERVHDGATVGFPDTAVVRVSPALDGELWCYGTERDFGSSPVDQDDPLPWAVHFLDRVSKDAMAPFTPGRITLRAADNRGNAFLITAEISGGSVESRHVP